MSAPQARQPAGASLDGLLALVARGDQAAFTELYHRTAAQVFGLVTFMLGDTVAARDVTAAVYQQLWDTAAAHDPARGSAHAWLIGLAHRQAAECLRARRGAALVPAAQLAPLAPLALPAALQRLDPPSRELLLLVGYRGYTAEQAASLLGLPAGTALPRLRAALRALPPAAAPQPAAAATRWRLPRPGRAARAGERRPARYLPARERHIRTSSEEI